MRTVVRFAAEVPGAGRPLQFKTRLADEKIGWRDLA
jgi:hypothetical protein